MNYDSQIAERVMLHFAVKGVPSLPVHDSFIVPVLNGYASECYSVMRDEFRKIFKQDIPVDGSIMTAIKKTFHRKRVKSASEKWDEIETEVIPQIRLNEQSL